MTCLCARMGSLVFATFSIVITALVFGLLINLTNDIHLQVPNNWPNQVRTESEALAYILLVILCTLLVAFIMSVLLLVGIIMNIRCMIRYYLKFGLIILGASTVAAIVLVIKDPSYWFRGVLVLDGCVVYFFILAMIYLTYSDI